MGTTTTQTTTDSDAIELKKDSKGNYGWSIKVYGNDTKTMMEKVDAINKELNEKYPRE